MTRLRIRLGELNMLGDGEPLGHADKELLEVVLHPRFDNLTKENDIALLRVSNKGLEFQVYFNIQCSAFAKPSYPIHSQTYFLSVCQRRTINSSERMAG